MEQKKFDAKDQEAMKALDKLVNGKSWEYVYDLAVHLIAPCIARKIEVGKQENVLVTLAEDVRKQVVEYFRADMNHAQLDFLMELAHKAAQDALGAITRLEKTLRNDMQDVRKEGEKKMDEAIAKYESFKKCCGEA